jgi:hypothetical protein
MPRPQLVLVVVSLVLCPGLTGCLHSYRAASVQVRDAATGRAVPQAEVGVSYHTKLDPIAPAESSALTATDGTATLSVTSYSAGKHFYVKTGDHYECRDIDEAELVRLPRQWLWPFNRTGTNRPPDFVIEITAPTPTPLPAR